MWLSVSEMQKCWCVFTTPIAPAKSLHWSSLTFITSRPLGKLNRIDHYWGAEECWDTKKGQKTEEKPGWRKPEAGDEEIYSWQPVKPISSGPQWHNGTRIMLEPRPGQRGGGFGTCSHPFGHYFAPVRALSQQPQHTHAWESSCDSWVTFHSWVKGQSSGAAGCGGSDKPVIPTQTFIQCRVVREQEERCGGISQGCGVCVCVLQPQRQDEMLWETLF